MGKIKLKKSSTKRAVTYEYTDPIDTIKFAAKNGWHPAPEDTYAFVQTFVNYKLGESNSDFIPLENKALSWLEDNGWEIKFPQSKSLKKLTSKHERGEQIGLPYVPDIKEAVNSVIYGALGCELDPEKCGVLVSVESLRARISTCPTYANKEISHGEFVEGKLRAVYANDILEFSRYSWEFCMLDDDGSVSCRFPEELQSLAWAINRCVSPGYFEVSSEHA